MRMPHLIGLIVAIGLTMFIPSVQAQRGGSEEDGRERSERDRGDRTDDFGGRRGFDRGGPGGPGGGEFGGRGGFDRGDFGGRGGFDRGGFGGGDFGGRGGFDRGGFGRGDFGGRGGFDRGGRGGFDRGGSGRDGDRSRGSRQEKEPPPRVTMDLQSEYVPGDANTDGQIAMSEWLQWKSRAALAQFLSLDLDADGILTPRELSKAGSAVPVDLAARFPSLDPAALGPAAGSPIGQSAPAATPPAALTSEAVGSPASSVPAPSPADAARHAETAKRFFKILDRDRDGSITQLEWNRSSRLKPKFEGAGADLNQPMSEEQFTSYYVKFSTTGSAS